MAPVSDAAEGALGLRLDQKVCQDLPDGDGQASGDGYGPHCQAIVCRTNSREALVGQQERVHREGGGYQRKHRIPWLALRRQPVPLISPELGISCQSICNQCLALMSWYHCQSVNNSGESEELIDFYINLWTHSTKQFLVTVGKSVNKTYDWDQSPLYVGASYDIIDNLISESFRFMSYKRTSNPQFDYRSLYSCPNSGLFCSIKALPIGLLHPPFYDSNRPAYVINATETLTADHHWSSLVTDVRTSQHTFFM